MSAVRVGVLNDAVAGFYETAEDERLQILKELRASWAGNLPEAEIVWSASDPALLGDAPSLDILVVDYGALWQNPDAIEHYGRLVRRYADNHPSAIILLWTEHTARVYRRVFQVEFLGHDFTPAKGYPGWCGVEDCGRPAQDLVHGEHGDPAFNILARYAAVGYRGMHDEPVADFWNRLRTWLGRS